MSKKYKTTAPIAVILCIIVGLLFIFLSSTGIFFFTLKTDFPTYPSTLPYYNVTGEQNKRSNHLPVEGFGPLNPPTKQVAQQIAEQFLQSHNLLPPDDIHSRTELFNITQKNIKTGKETTTPIKYSVEYSRKINNYPVNGPGDYILVEVAYNEFISDYGATYYLLRWRNLTITGDIEIISPSDAYEKLLNNEMINKPMQIETFPIHTISLAYYSYATYQEYYKPVWVFYGPNKESYYAVNATK